MPRVEERPGQSSADGIPGQPQPFRLEGRLPQDLGHYYSRPPPASQPPLAPPFFKARVNVLLFLATILTTMFAGALNKGLNPLAPISNLLQGLPFSAALLGILLAHEMGHYLTSRRHGVAATLPYFIPVPTLIGTMGAIIRMRSAIRNRRVLFDIGIAGPLAGMCVAIPVTIIGLMHSKVIEITPESAGLTLGDSLLFKFLADQLFGPLPESQSVLLHPVAFAGWLGFFVTSLNLIPISQLDGGHVAYGIFGRHHRALSRFVFVALVLWGVHGAFLVLSPLEWLWASAFCWAAVRMAFSRQQGYLLRGLTVFFLIFGLLMTYVPDTLVWILWATLLSFLRVDHPPTYDVIVPLDRKRKILGWLALLVFVLTFIPKPFQGVP